MLNSISVKTLEILEVRAYIVRVLNKGVLEYLGYRNSDGNDEYVYAYMDIKRLSEKYPEMKMSKRGEIVFLTDEVHIGLMRNILKEFLVVRFGDRNEMMHKFAEFGALAYNNPERDFENNSFERLLKTELCDLAVAVINLGGMYLVFKITFDEHNYDFDVAWCDSEDAVWYYDECMMIIRLDATDDTTLVQSVVCVKTNLTDGNTVQSIVNKNYYRYIPENKSIGLHRGIGVLNGASYSTIIRDAERRFGDELDNVVMAEVGFAFKKGVPDNYRKDIIKYSEREKSFSKLKEW